MQPAQGGGGRHGQRGTRRAGAGPVLAGVKDTDCARATTSTRRTGERQFRNWHALRELPCCPGAAGQLASAIRVLQTREAQGMK